MTFDELRYLIREGVRSVKQKSAVNPMLWLCAVVSPPSFFFSWTARETGLMIPIFVVGCIPIALAVFSILWFLFTDPDKLRSEEYVLKSRALDIIERKGGEIIVNPAEIENIVNPFVPGLPQPKEGGKNG